MNFKKIFWGLLFLLINFRIQGIDIVPDFIGYIFIYMGLRDLAEHDQNFYEGKKFALPLIILSIFSIYKPQNPSYQINFNVFSFILGIAILILNLKTIYHICMGISSLAINIGDTELQTTAENRWKYYLTVQIISMCSIILMFIPVLNIFLLIIIAVASITVHILLMTLMNKAQGTFGDI